jgi:hypothetical protein
MGPLLLSGRKQVLGNTIFGFFYHEQTESWESKALMESWNNHSKPEGSSPVGTVADHDERPSDKAAYHKVFHEGGLPLRG